MCSQLIREFERKLKEDEDNEVENLPDANNLVADAEAETRTPGPLQSEPDQVVESMFPFTCADFLFISFMFHVISIYCTIIFLNR